MLNLHVSIGYTLETYEEHSLNGSKILFGLYLGSNQQEKCSLITRKSKSTATRMNTNFKHSIILSSYFWWFWPWSLILNFNKLHSLLKSKIVLKIICLFKKYSEPLDCIMSTRPSLNEISWKLWFHRQLKLYKIMLPLY